MSKSKPTNNEEMVAHLMTYSKFGAISQAFVMEAIHSTATRLADATPEEVAAAFAKSGLDGFINPAAWHGVAKEVKEKLDNFYGRHEARAPEVSSG